MYLLDTNVVSELRKPKPHGAVMQWINSVTDAELHVSAVSIGEIQAGIEITREQDDKKECGLHVAADGSIAPRATPAKGDRPWAG